MVCIGYETPLGGVYTYKTHDLQDAYAMQCALRMLKIPFSIFKQGKECILFNTEKVHLVFVKR